MARPWPPPADSERDGSGAGRNDWQNRGNAPPGFARDRLARDLVWQKSRCGQNEGRSEPERQDEGEPEPDPQGDRRLHRSRARPRSRWTRARRMMEAMS